MSPGAWGRYKGLPVLAEGVKWLQGMGTSLFRMGGSFCSGNNYFWKRWRGLPWTRPSAAAAWGHDFEGGWGPFEMVDMANAMGVEAVITDLDTGRDPGIGAFAGGFVIAYRGLETEGLDGPTIRLAFTNIRGQVVETFDLDPTTATGGPVTVAVSLDGTAILVGWASDSEDGTDTFVRRIRCDG